MEGISLHDQAVWEETCHPLADTFTTWLPPAFRCPVSVSGAGTHSPAHTLPKYSRSSGLEGPEPKHLLFGLRNPRTRETSDVRKSIWLAVLFHSQVKQLMKLVIRYMLYDSSFLVTQSKKNKLKVSAQHIYRLNWLSFISERGCDQCESIWSILVE